MKEYEALLIVVPELSERDLTEFTRQFGEQVLRVGGKILGCTPLGKRRLSYRIKRVTEGIYLKVNFEAPPLEISSLRKTLALMEPLVRLTIFQGSKPPQETKRETSDGESK